MRCVALQSVLTALQRERRTRCVRGVVRMMAIEQSHEEYWRLTQIRRERDVGNETVAACFSLLRDEGVVVRAYTGGPQTYYRLNRPHSALIAVVERYADHLDADHEARLAALDPGFGTVTG